VVAIIDPNPIRTMEFLQVKRRRVVSVSYILTLEFRTFEDYLEHAEVPFAATGLMSRHTV